jgi:uncharacterized protein YndB with AHSA1/START domain/DNA-binding transcriptional ArsR family regulator
MAQAIPQTQIDRLWKAMADPARRRILDLLRDRPQRTGELADDLAQGFAVGRFMVMKHLKQLCDAGLVLVVRKGRERWNHLNAVPIQEIHRRWIEPFAAPAADTMLRLKSRAETTFQSLPTGERPVSDTQSAAAFDVQEVVVEVQINAPREKVWQTLTSEASLWWPKDYYVNAEGSTFHIEPKIGGYMFEDYGDGEGTIWATVTQVKKNESMRLSAEVWPEFGGPARSIHVYTLSDKDGGTMLRFADTMYGRVTAGTIASMTEGWNYLFGKAFKDYAEEGTRPPDSSPLSC